MDVVAQQSNHENLEQAFEIAESLGVTRLLDSEGNIGVFSFFVVFFLQIRFCLQLIFLLSSSSTFSMSIFFVSASDVDVPSPDEKSVITYVSSIYDAFPKIPEGAEGISAHVCSLHTSP